MLGLSMHEELTARDPLEVPEAAPAAMGEAPRPRAGPAGQLGGADGARPGEPEPGSRVAGYRGWMMETSQS
jgi:hypothetical protein